MNTSNFTKDKFMYIIYAYPLNVYNLLYHVFVRLVSVVHHSAKNTFFFSPAVGTSACYRNGKGNVAIFIKI